MSDWSSINDHGMNNGCEDKAFYGPKRKKEGIWMASKHSAGLSLKV